MSARGRNNHQDELPGLAAEPADCAEPTPSIRSIMSIPSTQPDQSPASPQAIPPGYKQTEVGVFPTDWDIAQLGNIADVEGGYAFSSKAFLASGTYQVVKMSNLYGDTLDLERSASFLNDLTEQERHYLLRSNHIIITLTGTTGKRDYGYSYMVTHEKNLLLNQRVARVVVTEKSCAGYVSFQLQSPCFLNQFFEVSKGGTGNQTNVGTQDVAAMRIPLPPLPEQRAIAAALSDVDGLLGALERLIAKKRDLKRAAMQQLLTGQQRLPGFTSKWETKRLGEVARIQRGASPRPIEDPVWFDENSSIGWVRISDVTRSGMFLRETTQRLSPLGVLHSRLVANGSLIMSICATVGRPVITEIDVCIHDGFVVFDNLHAEKLFVYYFLKWIEPDWSKHGQTGSQMNLNTGLINGTHISLPPLPEQTAIAAVLSDMDTELAALEARRDKTRALKQGMMRELLTGRVRLV